MPKPAFDETKIREAAYAIWLAEGQPEGRDEVHWQQAIDALTAAASPKAARKPKAAPKSAPKAEANPKAAAKPRKPKASKS